MYQGCGGILVQPLDIFSFIAFVIAVYRGLLGENICRILTMENFLY